MQLNPIIRTIVAAWALAAAALACAQPFPAKPIPLVVPFPPGGAVDFFARVVQGPLAENLGVPVIIDNKAGASGMIGAESVARLPADGYPLLIGNNASLMDRAAASRSQS